STYLLTMAGRVRVDGPAEMRDAMVRAAREVLALHPQPRSAAARHGEQGLDAITVRRVDEHQDLVAGTQGGVPAHLHQAPFPADETDPGVLAQRQSGDRRPVGQ